MIEIESIIFEHLNFLSEDCIYVPARGRLFIDQAI